MEDFKQIHTEMNAKQILNATHPASSALLGDQDVAIGVTVEVPSWFTDDEVAELVRRLAIAEAMQPEIVKQLRDTYGVHVQKTSEW